MYRRSQRWMLIINNRFLSLYDYNFLLVIEKIRKRNSKICGSRIPNVIPQPMIIHQRQILLLMEGCGLANENKPIEWKKEIIIKGIIKGKDYWSTVDDKCLWVDQSYGTNGMILEKEKIDLLVIDVFDYNRLLLMVSSYRLLTIC